MNLAGLPDSRVTEEKLAAVVRPFMQEVEEVHTTIVKKLWRDVILPFGATLITLGLLLMLGWALKMGKLYAMKKYVERFKGNDEETAAVAALQLSDIDAAQTEDVLQQERAKKSAPPEIWQRNELRKVAVEKLVSRLLSHVVGVLKIYYLLSCAGG